MVAGIGVGDAAAAGRDALQAALVDRFHKDQNRARTYRLLGFAQLLAPPELARRNVILHARDDHRNDRPRLGDAGGLGHPSDLYDLAFDLSKPFSDRAPP